MPDPKLDFWTAAWNLAVDSHIASKTWKASMQYIGVTPRQQIFIESMLRALQQLPEEAGSDIRLLVEARQNHELDLIRHDFQDMPLSIRIKLEALSRGEAKSLRPDWEHPFELPGVTSEAFGDGERVTSKLPYADRFGEVMNRERYMEEPSVAPKPRDTMPVPAHLQESLCQDSSRMTPIPPLAIPKPAPLPVADAVEKIAESGRQDGGFEGFEDWDIADE